MFLVLLVVQRTAVFTACHSQVGRQCDVILMTKYITMQNLLCTVGFKVWVDRQLSSRGLREKIEIDRDLGFYNQKVISRTK